MTEVASHVANQKELATAMELNNNNTTTSENCLNLKENSFTRPRSASRESMSSVSSCNSDTSDDFGEEPKEVDGTQVDVEPEKGFDIRKIFRSMSEGQAAKLNLELAEVFPSLPNSLLDKLGVHGEGLRKRMSEEEIEQKFVTLALGFTIDAATIKDRCERQRRYRDQTETNLISEIDRLTEKVNHIQRLCVDAESAELLAGVLAQIDVVIKAASHAAISAERFGAVQHEERLSEAVILMINHVTVLKQQRDTTRKQLQYTKKVLQDTNSSDLSQIKNRLSTPVNGKLLTKRRASIATISQDSAKYANCVNSDVRRITRRMSDLTTRASAFTRSGRPSRLELGVDLGKIKEGIVANGTSPLYENSYNSESEDSEKAELDEDGAIKMAQNVDVDLSTFSFQKKIICKYKQFNEQILKKYQKYSSNGFLHESFYFCVLVCFALGFIILGNLLIEITWGSLDWKEQTTYLTKAAEQKIKSSIHKRSNL